MDKQGEDIKQDIVINGLHLEDIIPYINTKTARYTAMTLQDIEEFIGKDHENYKFVRKSILDGFNNYKRSLVRAIFGVEIEETKFDGKK